MPAVCAICLNNNLDRLAVVIPCGHVFHEQCLYENLAREQKCPTCRAVVSSTHKLFVDIDLQAAARDDLLVKGLEEEIARKDRQLLEAEEIFKTMESEMSVWNYWKRLPFNSSVDSLYKEIQQRDLALWSAEKNVQILQEENTRLKNNLQARETRMNSYRRRTANTNTTRTPDFEYAYTSGGVTFRFSIEGSR